MKFKIVSKPRPNKDKFQGDEYDLTSQFASKLKKELGSFLRSVVLFGSTSRSHPFEQKTGDIDILLLVDDVTMMLTQEVIETYRIIVSDTAAHISRKFHVTTQKLTPFWDAARQGDPIVTNMLRDGVAVYDTGIFVPLQHLLLQGRIRPTKEAIWGYYTRAPQALSSAKRHVIGAVYDLYWACMDAAHAALMAHGHVPVTPEKVPEMLETFLVKRGHLEKRYVQELSFFYTMSRMITHREVREIKGEEYARYVKQAREFVERMRRIVEEKRVPL